MKLILIIFTSFYILSSVCILQEQEPDQFRDAVEVIKSRGFRVQVYQVVTPDGYILTLQRVINPYVAPHRLKKTLLLVHGILASSTDWLLSRPGHLYSDGEYLEDRYALPMEYRHLNGKMVPIGGSLAFVLSQFGYDVWLGNTRGTTYSMKHIRYDSKIDSRYWQFTLDQLALYDIPTMIQFILKKTRKESLGYICHSQGCTIMFALLSAKPKYSGILSDFIALAPVVFDTNLRLILPGQTYLPLTPLLASLPIGILTPFRPQLQLQGVLCNDKSLRYVCGTLLGIATGLNPKGVAYERISAFAAHFPSGVSTWVIVHFGQWIASGRFRRFDYGITQNVIRYGRPSPPDYNLANIKLRRISIFYSMNDQISNIEDVRKIKRYLSVPLYSENLVMDPKWGHYDYFSHKNVAFHINSKIIDLLR